MNDSLTPRGVSRIDDGQHRKAGLGVIVVYIRNRREVRICQRNDRDQRRAPIVMLPCEAVHPMSGGSAPGTAPTSVASDVRRLSGV